MYEYVCNAHTHSGREPEENPILIGDHEKIVQTKMERDQKLAHVEPNIKGEVQRTDSYTALRDRSLETIEQLVGVF